MEQQDNSSSKPFFIAQEVERGCKTPLRIIFDTLLLNKKVKQQDLADYLGLDKAFISRICNGVEDPSLRIKLKIAQYFNVDSSLIWREGK